MANLRAGYGTKSPPPHFPANPKPGAFSPRPQEGAELPSGFLVGALSGSFSSGLLFSGDRGAFTVGFFSLRAVLLKEEEEEEGAASWSTSFSEKRDSHRSLL